VHFRRIPPPPTRSGGPRDSLIPPERAHIFEKLGAGHVLRLRIRHRPKRIHLVLVGSRRSSTLHLRQHCAPSFGMGCPNTRELVGRACALPMISRSGARGSRTFLRSLRNGRWHMSTPPVPPRGTSFSASEEKDPFTDHFSLAPLAPPGGKHLAWLTNSTPIARGRILMGRRDSVDRFAAPADPEVSCTMGLPGWTSLAAGLPIEPGGPWDCALHQAGRGNTASPFSGTRGTFSPHRAATPWDRCTSWAFVFGSHPMREVSALHPDIAT
jgi:hypothetical protein